MSILAQQCIDDVMTKLKNTLEFGDLGKEKVFTVYSEGDLLSKTKLVKYPAVGVMYEGIRANSGDPTKQGLAADVQIALVLLLDGRSTGALGINNDAARLLDKMRVEFKKHCQESPTRHKWRFVSETPAGDVGTILVYVQRWSTPIILT